MISYRNFRTALKRVTILTFFILIAILLSASSLPGHLIGLPMVYGDMTTDLDGPAAAYDSQHQLYLLVWSVDNGAQDTIILTWVDRIGKLLSWGFLPVGPNRTKPDVAYNATRDEFLVVWQDDTSAPYPNIRAQVVDHSGPKGSELVLGDTGNLHLHTNPSVAYSWWQGEYLVVWESTVWQSGVPDIEGQYLYSWGTKNGTNFTIIGGSSNINHTNPDVAARMTSQGFMVVWEREYGPTSDTDIYGSRMLDDHPSAPILFATDSKDEINPAVSSSKIGTLGEFLVVWEFRFSSTNGDIKSRSYDGYNNLGTTYSIITTLNDQVMPDVAGSPDSNQYMITWTESAPSSSLSSAQGRNYRTIPYTLGDTFTFGGLVTGETAVAAGGQSDFFVIYEDIKNPFNPTVDMWGRLWGEWIFTPFLKK